MEITTSNQPQGNTHSKKGLGTGAKIGIGCGAIIALIILGLVIVSVMFGDKFKKFAEDAQQNPTRATATMMVSASAGTLTMVAEDDANKRYTVKDQSGKLITIYWDESKQAPEVIDGDFSAIPVVPAPPAGS
jgi:flagellar basal body-associated protein FliL